MHKNNLFSYLAALIFLFTAIQNFSAQEKKYVFQFEYAPNYAQITQEIIKATPKLSHNALMRVIFKPSAKLNPTLGAGYLNVGEIIKADINDPNGIKTLTNVHNNNYLMFPIGLKMNFGKFYALPELGIGLNLSNTITYIAEYSNGKTERDTDAEIVLTGAYNKISLPISLVLARGFKIKSHELSVGVKSYYGLNKIVRNVARNNHYYGFGLQLGVTI